MFYTYIRIFDVTDTVENVLGTKQGLTRHPPPGRFEPQSREITEEKRSNQNSRYQHERPIGSRAGDK